MSLPEKKSEGTSPLAPPPGFIYLKYGDGPPRLHRVDCSCQSCKWARERKTAGRKSKRELEAERKAAVAARKTAKLAARAAQEAAKVKRRSALETALVAQAQATGSTDIVAAAKLAGMEPVEAARVAKREDLITAALEKAGITDDKLAAVAAEGLDAYLTRVLVGKDGAVTDAVRVKDFHAIHKFLQTALTVKGYLGREEAPPAAGGLFIILQQEVSKARPSHPASCVCAECVEALEDWKARTKDLRLAEARRHAIEVELVTAPDGAPASSATAEDATLAHDLGQSVPNPDDEDDEDYYQTSPDEPKY